jgi:hypothetical protein
MVGTCPLLVHSGARVQVVAIALSSFGHGRFYWIEPVVASML